MAMKGTSHSKHKEEDYEKVMDKYQILFQLAKDAIFINDEDGNFIDVNHAACESLGYTREELLELNIKDIDVDSRGFKIFQKGINGPIKEITFEVDHRKRDGNSLPVEITGNIINIDDKQITLAIVRDITERKQAEKMLQESEKKYSTLVEKGNDGIIIIQDDVLKFANTMMGQITGFDIKNVIGMSFIDFVQPKYQELVMDIYKKRISGEEVPNKYEIEIISKDGKKIPVEINASSIEYEGRPADMAIVRDITEYKQAENVIKRKTKALEESNRVKDLFTDIMHHDLLNPLNIVSNYIEILNENETDPKKIGYLDIIDRNLSNSLELIDNAMMLSKLESLDSIELEDMDLKRVAGKVIKNFRPLADSSGIQIDNNLTKSMPIRANKIIEEVIANIISNAIKYAPKSKTIIVEGKDGIDFWIVKVIDFGEGINDADKTGIFERFLRREKKGVEGSGLGLAITRKIMELHQGRVWVEDNPKGGAVFIIEIPKS